MCKLRKCCDVKPDLCFEARVYGVAVDGAAAADRGARANQRGGKGRHPQCAKQAVGG